MTCHSVRRGRAHTTTAPRAASPPPRRALRHLAQRRAKSTRARRCNARASRDFAPRRRHIAVRAPRASRRRDRARVLLHRRADVPHARPRCATRCLASTYFQRLVVSVEGVLGVSRAARVSARPLRARTPVASRNIACAAPSARSCFSPPPSLHAAKQSRCEDVVVARRAARGLLCVCVCVCVLIMRMGSRQLRHVTAQCKV